MRVISGNFKGRKLNAVPGTDTRPLLDRVKTVLIDTLRPYLPRHTDSITEKEPFTVIDVFGGTGSFGIEALSNGAQHCIFLDIAKPAYTTIKKNIEMLGLETLCEVRNTDAFVYLRNTSKAFDILYLDPPQFKNLWIDTLYTIAERPHLVKKSGIIAVKIHPSEYELLQLPGFELIKEKKIGNSMLLFYKKV
jgi:16S rRNA (guanine966-N2)-methyltransferase